MNTLRPTKFESVVGQTGVVNRLRIAVKAARNRKEPLPHLLLSGPPGLGKTTLAQAVPTEMGAPGFTITSGPALSSKKDLAPLLTNNTEPGSVLFIDEIHGLPTPVEEMLYSAMEDFRLDVAIGKRMVSLKLAPFTLIGATTQAGGLSAPLRDRFPLQERVEYYDVEPLAEIIIRNSHKLGCRADPLACFELARRSRGTPRVANSRLLWSRDYVQAQGLNNITKKEAVDAMNMKGIDAKGLEDQDRKYLRTIKDTFNGGPAGLEAVSASSGIHTETLSDEVEPYLLRIGFVSRTPRGRVLAESGRKHLNGNA